MSIKQTRGARLARARKAAGLSQEQLAQRIGKPRSMVARAELGITTPSLDLAIAIARELGVSLDDLVGGESR
jgi:transcriptional regulator with XRE-family HTH domain